MKDVILIQNAHEFLTISDMTASYKLTNDIDLKGDLFTPIGTEDVPFCGEFDGGSHKISNVTIDATLQPHNGIFGVLEGKACDFEVENLVIEGELTRDTIIGSIIGINYGSCHNIHVKSGRISVSGSKKGCLLVLGGIVGESHNEMFNCSSAADITVATNGMAVVSGGIAGIAHYGDLETQVVTGNYTFTGPEKLIETACIIGYGENVIARANRFFSPMNLKNGKVYTNCYVKKTEMVCDGNCWRDNRNDDRFLPAGEYEMRKKAADHMRRMASITWTPDVDMHYLCSCAGKVHKQDFPAGVEQHGIPYAHTLNSYESFLDCFDEEGKLQPWLKAKGWNGFDMYMGVDCSGAVYWAWARISDKIGYRWTWNMRPERKEGVIALPGFVADKPGMNTADIWKANEVDDDNDGETNNVMYEAIAKLHMGDAILVSKPNAGHVRMCMSSAVVYRNEDGVIQHPISYVVTTEQGDGLLPANAGKSISKSWIIDRQVPFVRFDKEKYIPVTIPAFAKGKQAPERLSYQGAEGADCITDGKVKSNYRIICTKTTLTDKKTGEVAWSKKLYTSVYAWRYTESDYKARTTAKTVDMSDYAPYFAGARIPKGSYIYKLEVTLSTGSVTTVAEKEVRL